MTLPRAHLIPQPETRPYLTVAEAAQLARCHPKTIRRAFTRGTLRAFRPAHRLLVREDDVRAWIEAKTVVQAPPTPARPSQRRGHHPSLPAGAVAALRQLDPDLRASALD